MREHGLAGITRCDAIDLAASSEPPQPARDVFAWLRYHNHHRMHSTIGQNTPAETRTNHYAKAHAG